MPHATLKLTGGVDQNRTPVLNEAAISESNLVRFVPDKQGLTLVQKLGGWLKYFPANVVTVVRALWAWEDTNANTYLGVGSEGDGINGNGLSIIFNNNRQVITPRSDTFNVPFSAFAGATTLTGSNIVTIYAPGTNASSYDTVYIKTQLSVGGLVLFGTYQCIFLGADQFQVAAIDALGNPAPATLTVGSPGGSVPVFDLVAGIAQVTVTLPYHGYVAGDVFQVVVPTSCGNVTFYGNYSVNSVISSSQFVITLGATPSTASIISASTTGSVATIIYSGSYSFNVGDTVAVAGTVGYNGSHIVTASTSNSVSFSLVPTAPESGAGTVFNELSAVNGNQAQYQFFRTPAPLPTGTGYGVGGYGVGGYGNGVAPVQVSGTPITAVDWSLDNWGQVLIACPLNGPVYQWTPGSGSSVASIITQAPTVNDGVFVAMPQRQIIAWGSTLNGIQDPLLVTWCDVNDYNSWLPTITNQAGSYRIPRGSRIIGGIQGPQQGLLWTDLGIWAMQYVGPPYVYQFNEIGTGCGLIAQKAATSMNGIVYWMGQNQFFKLSGSGVETIRCPVWDVIFQDLDTTNLRKIRIAANSSFAEITWYYPTTSNGGEVSKYVKYNVALDQWDFGTLSRTAWINQSVLGQPIGAGISGGGFYIYQHETSPNADGAVMDSYFQTGYFVMSDAELKVFVDQIWPDMKWGYYGHQQNAHVNLTFKVADYPGPTLTAAQGGVRSYGPYDMSSSTTYLTPRFRGRLMAIRVESSPTEIDTFWRIGGIRYRFEQDGKF